MANVLTSPQAEDGTSELFLHQALHGYAEGHRLLGSSIPIPDDLKRPMLRMSDLSGASVVNGFQEYITGYPLSSLHAYALAKTWYAPEMSRPGCVWTHTLIIPASVMARVPSLSAVRSLFRRPSGRSTFGAYSEPIFLDPHATCPEDKWDSEQQKKLGALIAAYYRENPRPIVVPVANSDEIADLVFAMWSQNWPALRMSFTFCTGSISARTYENHPLDIQCVPASATRLVAREIADPVILNYHSDELPNWTELVAKEALDGGGPVRKFIWAVSDDSSTRASFTVFLEIYESLAHSEPCANILELTANHFPDPKDGVRLKKAIFGRLNLTSIPHFDSGEMLLALATMQDYQGFNPSELDLQDQTCRLMREDPLDGCSLLRKLFRVSLNPVGDEILKCLILAMSPKDAIQFADDQQHLLPVLFEANPMLGTVAKLWRIGKDRKRELFGALSRKSSIDPDTKRGIIDALLESNSDAFLGPAFKQWGSLTVREALDWIEAHDGRMTENCRLACAHYIAEVMTWIVSPRSKSPEIIDTLAHVVAPSIDVVARYDSTEWLHAFRTLRERGNGDVGYLSAFILALALRDAPPAPLDLVSESFELVHRLAELEQLSDDAWFILQPVVPVLSWFKNWDKCERLRRGLASAFVRYGWPGGQLRERIRSCDVLEEILRSSDDIRINDYFLKD